MTGSTPPITGLDTDNETTIESYPLLDRGGGHGDPEAEDDAVEDWQSHGQPFTSSPRGNSKFRRRRGKFNGNFATQLWRFLGSTIRGKKTARTNGLPDKGRSRPCLTIAYVLATILMLLGLIQLFSLVVILFTSFFPDQAAYLRDHLSLRLGSPSKAPPAEGLYHWPTDWSRDIRPVPCHSHNDYWRRYPLYSAIQVGCTGVEADVWLAQGDLFVGHSRASLTGNRTFGNLYVEPLMEILDKQNPKTEFHSRADGPLNGVFDTAPEQSLVLMVDFKTDGAELWPVVYEQLEPLRMKGYLTFVNGTTITSGPVTVVATGNAPFDLLLQNTPRDIFLDAPLDSMAAKEEENISSASPAGFYTYNATNSYYASTNFANTIGTLWSSPSNQQLDLIRSQIRGAHARGLKARYWNTPSWPRGLRNKIWNILIREGADYLNVDDLRDATEGAWGEW